MCLASADAYEICGVLHRDVSPANILIYRGKGLLGDWEFAKRIRSISGETGPPHSEVRQTHLTVLSITFKAIGIVNLIFDVQGTWQFMSSWIQTTLRSPHQHIDDLESFVHVNNWLALRFMRNNLQKEENWAARYFNYFDAQTIQSNGAMMGGGAKENWILTGKWNRQELTVESHPAITKLISKTASLFAPRYLGLLCEVKGQDLIDLFTSCLDGDGWPTETDMPSLDFLSYSHSILSASRTPAGSRSSRNRESSLQAMRLRFAQGEDSGNKRERAPEVGEKIEGEEVIENTSLKRLKMEEGSETFSDASTADQVMSQ
jgi:serine/threonine protein kinase